MNTTTVTTPNELEIRVERIFDAPRAHVFSVWTDPKLIPEWWGDGTVVEEMDVRPGGTYRFRTAYGVVEGEFREVDAPERLVQTFQNHLQTLEFEDLGDRTKLTQTMRFATTEERDTTMQYGVEEGAKSGFAQHRRAAAAAAGDTMSMATRTNTQSPALHAADSHDLIRVHGARVNNLKDVSIELPKRRLTVFTGVSGSGKSSLVFGTIAAESQRLINETYSAFVQGFMPTLARPEVDVLDGLTTAILVDQERMGANPRSTVGTATDANAMLRILFSRLGEPHIGPPTAFSFNVPTRTASGAMTVDKGQGERDRGAQRRLPGRHVPALRGRGLGHRLRPVAAVRREQVAQRGCAHDPRLQHGRLVRPHLQRLRLLRPGQADPQVHEEGAPRPALQGADQDQGRRDQPDVRGPDPEDPEVDAVQGRRRDAAAHPRLRGAGGHVHRPVPTATAPGSARRPGRRRSRGRTSPTSARCRSATWPTGSGASTSRRWRRCSPGCSTSSTRSRRSGWATSRSTGRRARCRAARRSAPR